MIPSYLGQNFLTDSKAKTYIRELVLKLKEKYNLNRCIEIGPGKGAITKLIQPIFNTTFWAIEKDTTFAPILEELIPEGQLIFNDVLQVDLDTLGINLNQTLIYGSLPYYITSPIISKVFLPPEFKLEAKAGNWKPEAGSQEPNIGVFIVQKEFAQKVEVNAKKKSYLWWLLNHGHVVTYHKTIPAKGFSPAPKVDSAIISIIKAETQAVNYHKMLVVLDKISGFKRKTIGKIVKMVGGGGKGLKMVENGNNIQQPETTGNNLKPLETIFPKRLEELNRNEMQILVDHLFHSVNNEN